MSLNTFIHYISNGHLLLNKNNFPFTFEIILKYLKIVFLFPYLIVSVSLFILNLHSFWATRSWMSSS